MKIYRATLPLPVWYIYSFILLLMITVLCACTDQSSISIVKAAGVDNAKISLLREHIDSLQMEEPKEHRSVRTPFCNELLSSIRVGKWINIIQPVVEASTYDDKKLITYKSKCPALALNVWEAPPHAVSYRATKDFRVFELPSDFGEFKKDRYFLFYAEGYFSPEEKERFRQSPQTYPWVGYAYPDGVGGGGLYSVIDTRTCEIGTQLVVHGRYNFKTQIPTRHMNQLFSYRDELFMYDFHLYSDEGKNYGGLVISKVLGPNSVQKICIFNSLDSRRQASDILKKNQSIGGQMNGSAHNVLPTSVSFAQNLVGTWEPESKNYLEFGDLVMKTDKLTWGICKDVPYSVLGAEDGTYYTVLQRSPSCRLRGEASFLIFEVTSNKLEVSICNERAEMDKAPKERLCSRGVLNRRN